ncbi:SDR family oxidoreductase [Prosthecomicrobium pneumaticum]|uniref:NAD(P)-dependent dehydrogenase (Short-subunit alcohol dehydrogenase family) n=1 Tax=Prosthecomicrobium pneumaticum TaxID=81895 RepID=A0A7W9CTN7_9HYPH|nr:SDR family oxidoreductase [Prosthecomicrobium pneumaticum]MBB5751672.1 NAD(P)-dependent dehydrogenase (short-subunit alcohol dehydrogenase family) [Prosthecomicrobium pneumaticum]
MEFSGKRVLVTGAGKGIGRAIVELLVERGARVVALSRSAADLDALAATHGCETIACDLADMAATRAAARAAQPVDLLVNNAGTTHLQSFLDVTEEAFDTLMAVNCKAALVVAQETAKSMIARGIAGAIVNVSSISSSIGFADHAAYCASKGALDSLTMVMANELGRQGIRVNAVNPIVTLTPMAVKAWSDPAKSGPMLGRIPLGRFVEPREVAEVVAYLLSDRAAMVNGTTIPIDGGFLIN